MGARTCVGCGARISAAARDRRSAPVTSVRLVASPEGVVAVDARPKAMGRGAHVHLAEACLAKAVARRLGGKLAGATPLTLAPPLTPASGAATAESVSKPLTAAGLASEIAAALGRRLAGLVTAAKARHELAIGTNAVDAAAARIELLLTAADAGAVIRSRVFVRQAVERGRALVVPSKVALAELVGAPNEVALAALTHTSLASEAASVGHALAQTVELARQLSTPRTKQVKSQESSPAAHSQRAMPRAGQRAERAGSVRGAKRNP